MAEHSTKIQGSSGSCLVEAMGVEQLKMMYCRRKHTMNAGKSEGIMQLCLVMPDSVFDIWKKECYQMCYQNHP